MAAKTYPVKWYQNKETVFVTISVTEPKDPKIEISLSNGCSKVKIGGASKGAAFETEIELSGLVGESKAAAIGNTVKVELKKADTSWWDRLQKEKKNPSHITPDWDRWEEQDSEKSTPSPNKPQQPSPGGMKIPMQILKGEDGKPVMMPDGKPLMVMQGIMPQPIMGPEGKPAMGPDGKMLGALPVGPGQPQLGPDGKPEMVNVRGVMRPKIGFPAGSPQVIVDSTGRPLMKAGMPMFLQNRAPPPPLIDEKGKPAEHVVKGRDGKPVKGPDGKDIVLRAQPVMGDDGKPLMLPNKQPLMFMPRMPKIPDEQLRKGPDGKVQKPGQFIQLPPGLFTKDGPIFVIPYAAKGLDGVDGGGAQWLKLKPEEMQALMQQQKMQQQQQMAQQHATGGMQVQHQGRDSVTGKPIMKFGDGPIPESLPEMRPAMRRLLDNLHYDPNKDENAKFIVADSVGSSWWERTFSLTFSQTYLVVFNMAMFFGWASVMVGMLNTADLKNADVYGAIEPCGDEVRDVVDLLQVLATLEFFNVLLKLVRGNMISTMMQLFGRDLVQFVIIGVATNLKGYYGVSLLYAAWAAIEVIRYPFYAFSVLGMCPYWLKWLRYTLFIVLYPVGFMAEMLVCYKSMKFFQTTDTFSIANEEGVLFNFTTFLVLYMVLAYGIGAPYLYLHMFKQRSKQLGGGEKLKVQ